MQSDTQPTVFISYGREDAEPARRLSHDLRQAGLIPWIDVESLRAGEHWREAIRRAIGASNYFVALLSSRTVNRKGFMNWELFEALDQLRQFPQDRIYLVPVRLNECEAAHARLADLHWVDLFPDWSVGLNKLLTVFRPRSASPHSQRAEVTADATSYLRFSDLQAMPDRSAKTCTLDLRVVNTGAMQVLINRVQLTVQNVEEYLTLGAMKFSETYDLDISSLRHPGDTISCGVAQMVRPGEVDRFGVRLIATRLGIGVFRGWRLRVSLDTTAGRTEERQVEVWLPYGNQPLRPE